MDQNNFIWITISLVCFSVAIISLRYAINLRNYLKEFTRISKKVSNKDFNSKISIKGKGELSQVVNTVNDMIETINITIREAQYKNLQLKSIVKSISHGILAIDVNGNILLLNEECKRILKIYDKRYLEGINIASVVNEKTLLHEMSKFIGSNHSETIVIKNKDDYYYKIKSDPIYLQGSDKFIIGSIINIEDITEKVKLETMRTDFVANVSHELKTPLTSISGFVETLRNNENIDINTRNRFLGIIETESDRLKRLIDDILQLSFIESNKIQNDEQFNVYEVFKEVYELTYPIAQSKNIQFKYNVLNENINIISNKDYIKQIFLNLVDNAIKYTPENEQVFVRIFDDVDKLTIKVIDSGIGIKKEDIDRIFERFYRVDKARSKKVGGTGLGLAIVKHMVKSLDGTITVKSEIDKGSEFIVEIPKKNFLE